MNKKGLYSGGVALATVVLVIAVSFNIASTVQAGESQGKADAILDAKWEVQNAGRLLEIATVDAIIDAIFVECSYNEDLIKSTIESYVLVHSTIGQMECMASNIEVDDHGSHTAISFDLECSASAATGLTTNYKKTISFNKRMDITKDIDECTVVVNDYTGMPFGHSIEITGEITG